MIDFNIEKAQKQVGELFEFVYNGNPEFDDIVLDGPLALKTQVYFLDNKQAAVSGNFTCTVQESCSRCLCDVQIAIGHDFEEVFLPAGGQEDPDSYTYEDKLLSMDQLVRDAIVLNVPAKVLCKEECKGLCPQCGADLNDVQCGCEAESVRENPFAKLKELHEKDGGVK